jgi:hypothetical protein
MKWDRLRWAALIAFVVGSLVALTQLRQGIIPLLDTVTYWSGAESVASGNLFRTTLAPSFSNFDAIDFLERGGSLPFVDFPVAYPLLAGAIGSVIGTRAAMHALTVIAVAAIALCIVSGSRTSGRAPRSLTSIALVAGYAVLVPFLPAMRLVTQGTLSEPLFIVCVLAFVISSARFRSGGSWSPVVVFVICASLLRFLGAPLAVLAGWEHFRRTKSVTRSAAWTGAMVLPAGLNVLLASSAGGGHSAGWRGLDRIDIEVFVRSIGGWFDATQGDIRRTYFTTDGPAWWSWPVAIAVVAIMSIAVIAVVRQRRVFTDTADLALTSAAILTLGLFAGILGFDALVIADNRLMLPAGILVSSAIVWTVADHLRPNVMWRTLALGGLAVWGVVAVRPWNVMERFSDIERPLAMSNVLLSETVTSENVTSENMTSGSGTNVEIVISNDADGVHWDTGIPAAYTPMSVKPLTGEIIDDSEVYRRLPCALLRANGVILVSNETTFSTVDRDALDSDVSSGRLRRIDSANATVYAPSSSACD